MRRNRAKTKDSSCREYKVYLAWAANTLPLTNDKQTAASSHNALYVLHRWCWMLVVVWLILLSDRHKVCKMILYPFPSWTILLRNAYINDTILEFAMSMISSIPGLPWLQFLISFICKNVWSKTGAEEDLETGKVHRVIWITMVYTCISEQHYECMNSYQLPHFVTWPPNTFYSTIFLQS